MRQFPIVVAANRDEFFARPAGPPAISAENEAGRPKIIAPQDLEAGGTWMGLNSAGLFVGLTNRPTEAIRENRRSRGLLVRDALSANRAIQVADEMKERKNRVEGTYNPFHLLYSDGSQAFLTWLDETGVRTRELEPGVHVVCNRDEDDPSSAKTASIRRAVEAIPLSDPIETVLKGLTKVLGSHPNPDRPLENACVHTAEYGTRSSSLIAVGDSGSIYRYSHGAPCESTYEDITRLLDELH
ncbi:MAG: NRDE family protein [bacterium]|nr:NRDE family protein [bacterium]